MSYCTQSDMVARFGADELIQLTDRANVGAIDAAVLAQAIADATAVIDGYLRSAYSLPLLNTPPELVRVCCDLSRFYLFGDHVVEAVQKRRDEAMIWLRDVAAKRVSLVEASGQATAIVGGVKFTANPRVFNAANLGDY